MESTNKKSSKGLIICLTIFLVAFATCAVLLFTGVIKSPMVKEKDCTETKCSTDTKADDKKSETKTDTTTEKTADERYKDFISNLAASIKNDYFTKTNDNGTGQGSFAATSYQTVDGAYRMSIDKDLNLVRLVGHDSTIIDKNVVLFFRVHTGNGIPSTIYYVNTEGKLYSVNLEDGSDYKIEEVNVKNVVKVVSGSLKEDNGQRAIFIDIDGNVITE